MIKLCMISYKLAK